MPKAISSSRKTKPAAGKAAVKKAAPAKAAAKKAVAKKPAVTKAPAKKTAAKKELKIKYEDKSAGQSPELVTIWNRIRQLMEPYVKGAMRPLGDKPGQYVLINHKPFEFDGRKRDELWFASILIQKGYVGFYFMPVYSHKEIMEVFRPELLKCLKGKACFHIKKDDPVLYQQIKDSLKLGYDVYKKRGWI
jgi:hypothetical protein